MMQNKKILFGIMVMGLFLFSSCGQKAMLSNKERQQNDESITVSLPEIDSLKLDLEPLVCTLSGPEQFERKEALKKEIFSQVKNIEEIDSGYVFQFEDNEVFLIKLMDYISVEKECCPFFKYEVLILPYQNGISLTVTGSADVKSVLEMVVEEIKE